MSASIFTSVLAGGGNTARYGEFVIVKMSNCSFITTPLEFQQMSTWARGRVSSGQPHRDRTAFVERFSTLLGRIGSGVSNRGNRPALSRIVKNMKANGMVLGEWNIPHDLDASVEIVKKPAVGDPARKPGTHS
jgi:hypothetical protein